MIPLFTEIEFKNSKSFDLLPCKCKQCNTVFNRTKHQIQCFLNPNHHTTGDFCSKKCSGLNERNKQQVICLNCSNIFFKYPIEIKRSPKHFCSRSCATIYNNKNKKIGNKRSKLEIYIQEQLTMIYPQLEIDYNKKNIIGSELDIYIPSLKLAFELNGIVHYEPIYGSDKLYKIKENDISKSKACFENKIDLCVIDSSGLKYFKPSNAQKYLDIIVNIIKQRTIS